MVRGGKKTSGLPCRDEEESSLDSESDGSENLEGRDSSAENMSTSSEDCVVIGKKVQTSDSKHFSDSDDDDFVSCSLPHCTRKFGLPAVSTKDTKRQQLDPVIKLLNEKYNIVDGFLHTAKYLSNVKFKEHFRIKRSVVLHLTYLMECEGVLHYKSLTTLGHSGGLKESELSEFCILLFLRYLSSLDPLLNISHQLDIPPEHLWRIICRVASWLRTTLMYVVAWPTGIRLSKLRSQFWSGKNGCIGAICGTQVSIKQPPDSADDYLNKDGFHSVHLQVVATADHRFANVYCGDAGSLDSLRVWKRSPLRANAKRNTLIIDELFPDDTFLAGKHPYELGDHILHPYKRVKGFSLRTAHHKYNSMHHFCMDTVEDAVKQLKGRFPRLTYMDYYCLDDVPDIITTCCILHNFCLDNKDTFEDYNPFSDLKPDRYYSSSGDDDSPSTKAKPKSKMEIGDDRRDRLLKKEFSRYLERQD